MRTFFVLISFCFYSCAASVKSSARFNPGVVYQILELAKQSFDKRMPCSLPYNTEVIIKDATLIELNTGHNIFGSDGLYIVQGRYEPEIKTILLASERPDRRIVLFHELMHFFIMESEDCKDFRNIEMQHKYINIMEDDFLFATRRTRQQEEDYTWIMLYLEQLKKVSKSEVLN